MTSRDLVVVHDELDLDPGRVQLKFGGGLAGHNGLRSIAPTMGTQEFARLRIGIGKPPTKEQGADYVLRRPRANTASRWRLDVARAADAIETVLEYGLRRGPAARQRIVSEVADYAASSSVVAPSVRASLHAGSFVAVELRHATRSRGAGPRDDLLLAVTATSSDAEHVRRRAAGVARTRARSRSGPGGTLTPSSE